MERQKRGLPHAHILLLWLYDKITSNKIEDLNCAEIPDADVDKDLNDVVTKTMIHWFCGTLNPNSPCMIDGKWSKRYPRALVCNTVTGNDGHPIYRRSAEDGVKLATMQMRNGDVDEDSRWVVPYLPLL